MDDVFGDGVKLEEGVEGVAAYLAQAFAGAAAMGFAHTLAGRGLAGLRRAK